MSTQITLEYLAKLLNRPMSDEVEIILSSAQKSRVHGWLVENNIPFDELALAGKFNVNKLLFGVSGGSVPLPPSGGFISTLAKLNGDNLQIGIDMQIVSELFPEGLSFDPKVDPGLTQIFTVKELSYAQSKSDPKVTLAGIFCAKEAILKASNAAINFKEIEVLPDETDKPMYKGFALSISHSGDYAIAIAFPTHLPDNDESLINNNLRLKNNNSHQSKFFQLRKFDIVLIMLFSILAYSNYLNFPK